MNNPETQNINSLDALSRSIINFWVCVPILIFAFIGVSCHHPDDPPPPPPVTEGKRDYTWTVDTLLPAGDGIQFLASGIWGTSPANIYVVGETDNNRGSVRHYDGKGWTTLKVSSTEGGPLPEVCQFRSIYGFAANDIWVGGGRDGFLSRIVHFDGIHWADMKIAPKGEIVALWGSEPSDIWAGGGSGERDGATLFHYDGISWKPFALDSTLNGGAISGFSNNDVFGLFGRFLPMPDSIDDTEVHLMHWNGQSWTSIDSFTFRSHSWKFGMYMWTDANHDLFTSGLGVYQFIDGGAWKKLLNSEYILRLGGSSNFNIFAAGDFGAIHHWNGHDWKEISSPFGEKCFFTSIWTNNVETFLVGDDGRRSYVLHGR